jgi:hypothetical protein
VEVDREDEWFGEGLRVEEVDGWRRYDKKVEVTGVRPGRSLSLLLLAPKASLTTTNISPLGLPVIH